MRDYGKVYSSFWQSSTMWELSKPARDLVLYLLTCPQGNSAGVFYLPAGYACNDMRTSFEEFFASMDELESIQFVKYCKTTKWVWVRNHFEFNPLQNSNQVTGAKQTALEVPKKCAWRSEYLISVELILNLNDSEMLGTKTGLNDPASEPFRNPFETLSEPSRNPFETLSEPSRNPSETLSEPRANGFEPNNNNNNNNNKKPSVENLEFSKIETEQPSREEAESPDPPTPTPPVELSLVEVPETETMRQARLLAVFFRAKILQRFTDHSLKNPRKERAAMEKWPIEIERLIRLDGRSPPEIRDLIEWVTSDNFWSPHCQEPRKLREKWDQLAGDRQRKLEHGNKKKFSTTFERSVDGLRQYAERFESPETPPTAPLEGLPSWPIETSGCVPEFGEYAGDCGGSP
jgi:hypothetical protein